jgi:hypothetical protein
VFLRSVLQLLVTANVVPSSLILYIPMMVVMRSSETSAFQEVTRRQIARWEFSQQFSYFDPDFRTFT